MTLSIEETAKLLGERYRYDKAPFTRRTINRWMNESGMPFIKAGPFVSFREPDVIEWAEKTFVRSN